MKRRERREKERERERLRERVFIENVRIKRDVSE